MALESYSIDRKAHDLVQNYYTTPARGQAHKMRMTVPYGLERFWGEHLRLTGDSANYWKETWTTLVEIMENAGVRIPSVEIPRRQGQNHRDPATEAEIQRMTDELWSFPQEERKVALAILTELCDCMVWWTQRYKKLAGGKDDE